MLFHFKGRHSSNTSTCSLCVCLCIHVSELILKSLREVPVHVFVHVPSAHLALVTAPVTCVWFCSIPAPHRSSAGEQSNNRVLLDLCCCGSQDPWQYECTLLYSRLEMASCWPLRYFFSIFVFKIRLRRVEWNQRRLLPDIYVIIKICHWENWFMLCPTIFLNICYYYGPQQCQFEVGEDEVGVIHSAYVTWCNPTWLLRKQCNI